MSTTAKVTHRDYVPHDWLAIKFCDIEFIGDDKGVYKNEWDDIQYKKLSETTKITKPMRLQVESLKGKSEDLWSELEEHKKKLYIFETKERRQIKNKILENDEKRYELEERIESLESDSFYSVFELLGKATDFLDQNGFKLTNSSSSGGECRTKTDIWQKD